MSTAAPHLTAVPDLPPAPLTGVVVEKATAVGTVPLWARAADHVRQHHGYAPLVGRGYARLGRRWLAGLHDYHPHMIATAEQALDATQDVAEQEGLRIKVEERRARYRRHRLIYGTKTGMWATTAATAAGVGTLSGGLAVSIAAAVGAYLYGIRHGIGDEIVAADSSTATLTLAPGNDPPTPDSIAPLDEEELRAALHAAGFTHPITVINSTPMAADGTRTVTFDLGGATTVTELQKKTEPIAAALGRDVTMVDIGKVPGKAGRASLWMSGTDPFEATRPSPLLSNPGPIDAWSDGVPVGWSKRGHVVCLPIHNSHFLIGGTTRSGKGVGMANLMAGAAMDVRINLRLAAGKENGEFDAYARSGVAATYFKPNPKRLLALVDALLADMDRRNRILGKLGKSKMTTQTIMELGGMELVVIDELATFTANGSHEDRDELTEKLMKLAAVCAGAGIILVLTTQLPQVDVVPSRLAMNCLTKWAMKVDSATQSNTILGSGLAGAGGPDASKFDPPRPGLGWMANPFAGVIDLARSFDLDEDERGEVTKLMEQAATLRQTAGRLTGQWDDPIEQHLLNVTGLSSAAGGPNRDGRPGRSVTQLTGEQRLQLDAIRGALAAMDQLGRDEAQTDELAEIIGGAMTSDGLGALLRAGGAGGTVKITVPHKEGRVNGYRRADLEDALKFLSGA
ncbi:FtsK/SpoIIIE domain-containing protein [Streptomyces virginiae]|uniref:FtsK/SpoIIIE domain-containing protein n=1 Tax=Streptomyces virginiae TaxID=1961 RepID=UPI00365538F0